MVSRITLALAVVLVACVDPRRPPDTAVPADTAAPVFVTDAAGIDSGVLMVPTNHPWLQSDRPQGTAALDTTLRDRDTAPQGVAPGRTLLAEGTGLYPGDVVTTATDGHVALHPLGSSPTITVTLGADAALEVSGSGGAIAVLSLGVADIMAPKAPVRVDTPAGRVVVAGGTALVGVAGDGSVVVLAVSGVVTVWPSPAAPTARRTRLTSAEIARLRTNSPGHPVLLDVDLPDLAASAVRPVTSQSIPPDEVFAWDPLGAAHRHGPAVRSSRATVLRWIAAVNTAVARHGAHILAIAMLGRAGGGDVADARAAIDLLHTQGDALPTDQRQRLIHLLSLALGRGTARARRGRDLAGRGGDVTALVQLAPIDDLREAARGVLPHTP